MMRLRPLVFGLCLVASITNTSSAQGMRDRIRELFSFGECGRPLCLDNSVNATNGHGDHFIPDLIARNGAILGFLADAIAANASNLPLSASASGETYRFVGGLPVKTSGSLGPIFGERYQTLGKNRWVVGSNMTGVNFTSLRGVPLNDIILNFSHDDVPPAGLGQPLRENDVLQVTLDLNVNLLVTTFFATWGATDKLDIGLAVPVVHTGLTGRSTGQFFPFGIPTSHFFAGDSANPVLPANATTYGFETGLGDIAVRAKWNAYSSDKAGSPSWVTRGSNGSTEDSDGVRNCPCGLVIGSAQFGTFAARERGLLHAWRIQRLPAWHAGLRPTIVGLGDDGRRRDQRVAGRGELTGVAGRRDVRVSGGAPRDPHQYPEHRRSQSARFARDEVQDAGWSDSRWQRTDSVASWGSRVAVHLDSGDRRQLLMRFRPASVFWRAP
jgi:hypothetical protein